MTIYIYIYNGFMHFAQKEEEIMRITIDTELNRVIVPDTFFKQIDKMNDVLKARGANDKLIDYDAFIKEEINKALENAPIRKSDVSSLRR